MQLVLSDPQATEAVGAALFAALPSRALIFLNGNLGAGKTTLVRGLLRAAGYDGTVKSPTYTLVEEYSLATRQILHFDLYRLADPEELYWMGIDDYLSQNALCCIEWPERGKGVLPAPDLIVDLQVVDNARALKISVLQENLRNALNSSIALLQKNNNILLQSH